MEKQLETQGVLSYTSLLERVTNRSNIYAKIFKAVSLQQLVKS